jgi:hypothetical protein
MDVWVQQCERDRGFGCAQACWRVVDWRCFAFGLAGGIAQAAPAPAPDYHWCPGDQWDPGWGKAYDWDWNHCHDWQGPAGQIGPTSWGPLGSPAAVGAAAATSTAVGAWGPADVEPDCQWLGILEQRNMDFDLRKTR